MIPPPATPQRPHSGRRQFLKTTAAGVAGGSLLTMLQARQAPAQIKGTSLRILQWSHFVPAYDTWFDGFVKKWGEQNGVKVRIDRIPHLDLPSRFAAELAAGAGHDLVYFVGTILTALYHRNLVDLTDIAGRIEGKFGGWIPAASSAAKRDGRSRWGMRSMRTFTPFCSPHFFTKPSNHVS